MEFNERFKRYSNTELLRVIDNPDSYQSKAIKVAKELLSDRQLTEEEIKSAKEELEMERQKKSDEKLKKRAVENKFRNVAKSMFDNLNPIQKEKPTSEKTIKTISLLFGGLFLFQLYKEFGTIISTLADNPAEWDVSVALFFLPLIVLSIAIILFYKRKKSGWLLLTLFLTYSAIFEIGFFIVMFNIYSSSSIGFNGLLPQNLPIVNLFLFLFFAGTIWAISRKNVRDIYGISKQTMILTISIMAIIVGIGFRLMI